MEACAHYRIIPELNLVIEYFGGVLTIEDIINTKKQEIKENYDPEFNFIVDFRDVQNIFNEKELIEYIEFVSQRKEFVGTRKSAIISNSSVSLVTTSIYAMHGKRSLPMDIKIVQNLSEAMHWTEVEKNNYHSINEVLSGYKETCLDR